RGKGETRPGGFQGGLQVEIGGCVAEVQVLQLLRVGKDQGCPGIRAQRFPSCPGGQVDVAQVKGHGPQTADTIDTDLATRPASDGQQSGQVVKDASARLLMDTPDPVDVPTLAAQPPFNRSQVPRLAPAPGERLEGEPEAGRLPAEPLAKFAVDQ